MLNEFKAFIAKGNVVDLAAVNLQPGPDASVAVSSAVFDNAGNGIFELCVVGLGW